MIFALLLCRNTVSFVDLICSASQSSLFPSFMGSLCWGYMFCVHCCFNPSDKNKYILIAQTNMTLILTTLLPTGHDRKPQKGQHFSLLTLLSCTASQQNVIYLLYDSYITLCCMFSIVTTNLFKCYIIGTF